MSVEVLHRPDRVNARVLRVLRQKLPDVAVEVKDGQFRLWLTKAYTQQGALAICYPAEVVEKAFPGFAKLAVKSSLAHYVLLVAQMARPIERVALGLDE